MSKDTFITIGLLIFLIFVGAAVDAYKTEVVVKKVLGDCK